MGSASDEASTAGKVISCKAAVIWAVGENPVIEQIEVAPPEAGEVRIRILYTSICHSDLHVWKNQNTSALHPRILGHEAAGIVESVGEGVSNFTPGDHVLPIFMGECKECSFCKSRKTNICPKFSVNPMRGTRMVDGKSRFSVKGQTLYSCYSSTFSQYTVVEQQCVVKINPNAEMDKVLLLSCGAGTGLGSAWNSAKVEPKATVAIFGLGAVGCSVAEGARVAGASRIIGVDVNPAKFEKGKLFGITDFVNPNDCEKPIDEVIREMTNGGVDYSFECVGIAKLMESAIKSCMIPGGLAVICGVTATRDAKMEVMPQLILRGVSITGSMYGGWKLSDIPELVERYIRKEFQIDELITHRLPFAEFGQAWQLLVDGESLRSVISCWD
ncbi:hypothetical protein Mapa_008380 [Marchantia paleacea]|nr:hypothetical protein Mapa_008380 [Marchantia paleacea]